MDAHSPAAETASLGAFLRERRARLMPQSPTPGRRRTPGLRREEVAARAGVSVTWYTFLEQGRGGAPSDAALERLAQALELDGAEREILFLLARQRPPPRVAAGPAPSGVSPTLQRTLDAMPATPAFVRTASWDIVAWNRAAACVLGSGPADAEERNSLRRFFLDPSARVRTPDWDQAASALVASFRLDVARAGPGSEAAALATELQAVSGDFRRFWALNEVKGKTAQLKRLQHPVAGPMTLEFQSFAVDGEDALSLVVCTPPTVADARAVAVAMAAGPVVGALRSAAA